MTGVTGAEPGVSAKYRPPVANEADIETGTARIADYDLGRSCLGRTGHLPQNGRQRRTGADHVDGPVDDAFYMHHTAERDGGQQLPLQARGAQVCFHLTQMVLHQWLQGRINGSRRSATVLAHNGV